MKSLKRNFQWVLILSILVCPNAWSAKGSVPGNDMLSFGRNIGNMVGIAYGIKVVYDEIQSRCAQWSPESTADIKVALDQWQERNKVVIYNSKRLMEVTVDILKKGTAEASITEQQKQTANALLKSLDDMLPQFTQSVVGRLENAPMPNRIQSCKQTPELLNSKKMDPETRNKQFYQLLMEWNEDEFKKDLEGRLSGKK